MAEASFYSFSSRVPWLLPFTKSIINRLALVHPPRYLRPSDAGLDLVFEDDMGEYYCYYYYYYYFYIYYYYCYIIIVNYYYYHSYYCQMLN